MFSKTVSAIIFSFCVLYGTAAHADITKASEWLGQVVVTQDGALLGRVEDFGVDSDSLQIEFVVISIGSFLIDNNLIAVEPSAIGSSDDGEYLVVYADDIGDASRFGSSGWPNKADVVASAERRAAVTPSFDPNEEADSRGMSGESEGVATISNGRRTAVIRGSDRNVSDDSQTSAPQSGDDTESGTATIEYSNKDAVYVDPAQLSLPAFRALDVNDDGRLSRSEIGARLSRLEKYATLDVDDSGAIDPFEYDLLVESRGG